LLIASQFQAEIVGNLPGNILLDSQDVGNFAVILRPPELCAGCCIHQIHLNVERVAHLAHSSHQHRAHVQIAPDLLRISLSPLVSESRAARRDSQPLKLRKAVDQAFADAVRKIFHARIGAGVRERQNRD
jgi:hypothetical protein